MGRPRLLNIETSLDEALALFLKRGYGNTSTQDIADRLGVSRSTIHSTFGDKHALFERALQHYVDTGRAPGLNDADSPRAALLQAFTSAIDDDGDEHDYYRLGGIALELARRAPVIAATFHTTYEELETQFRTAIEQGQAANEVAGHVVPTGVASVLLGLYLGLGVLIRAGAAPPVLHAVADQVQTLVPAPA